MDLKQFNHPGKTKLASFIFRLIGGYVLRYKYKIEIESEGEIPENGPLLVLSKHQRIEDVPLGAFSLYHTSKGKRDPW